MKPVRPSVARVRSYSQPGSAQQPAFVWGAATSAHQVEGNNIHSDWWAWEKATPGQTQSGLATDHYRVFREDFALARTLGHTAHRLSLEWSRIEYAPGRISHKALEHYREVLLELKTQELTSFVTLHHFTNPQWIARQGGWTNPATVSHFENYVRLVVAELGDLIDVWLTINEPVVYATHAYWHKRWPPQQRSWRHVQQCLRCLAAAHRTAYQVIHRTYPLAQVGLAHSVVAYLPARSSSSLDRAVVATHDWWYNHRFLHQTRGTHDFLGLNFYMTAEKGWQWTPPFVRTVAWHGAVSDLGWPIRPEGLTHVLRGMKRYQLPIYITENGLADAADSRRAGYLRSHIRAVEQAQAVGVDVRGYFHWSLLDNFEWAEGFTPRFGLVEVDYQTQVRRPRPSAYVYRAIIQQAKAD